MLIAVDIGNTNIKIGLFEGNEMVNSFKLSTDAKRTSDEYRSFLLQLLSTSNIAPEQINDAIISSVLPQLDYTFNNVLSYCFGVKPIMVGVGVKTGLSIKYDFPRELGSDRIITCVAAMHKYGAPFVLVDFGTATTFNVVNDKREFVGGAITLGLKSTAESLAVCTGKLPRVELEVPQKAVGQSTVKAIQSGVIYGAVGQVKYVVERLKRECGLKNAKVIATGGLAELVDGAEHIFDYLDRNLSLNGLNYIYSLNK
ncbi:MAG: type III pantothenate kinase [Corallococcus sp.]|nr:type III pantothenate kinase [Corallococcus sp.]